MTTKDLLSTSNLPRMDDSDESRPVMDSDLASLKEKIIRRKQAQERHYRGIRGWLVVFILLVAGGSLVSLLSGIIEWRTVQGVPGFLLFVPRALIAIYGFDVLFLLLCGNPSAPSHAARWMIANLVATLVMAIVVYSLTRSIAGFIVFLSALGLAPWIAYLNKSKRVAATYSRLPAR